jgi:hypothetical protein
MIVTNVSDLERSVFFIFDFYAVRARAPRRARRAGSCRLSRLTGGPVRKLGGRVARPM